jgi:hypothetical protein
MKNGMFYRTNPFPTREIAVALREIRNILRLLGCSRQDVASEALKRRSFERVTRSSDHPAHDSRRGADARLIGRSWTGLMARPIMALQATG